MAKITFELENSAEARRDLRALGAEHEVRDDRITLVLEDVAESEALFLAVKGITGHGMVAAPIRKDAGRGDAEEVESVTQKRQNAEPETKKAPEVKQASVKSTKGVDK